jgi:hypothetical protein
MNKVLTVLIAAFGTVFAQDTQRSADSFSPAPSQVFYLDLDTAAGASSQWRHDVVGPLNALRATVRIPAIQPDPKWSPTFALWLEKKEAGQKHDRVTLQVLTPPGQKPPFAIRILRVDDGKLIAEEASDTAVHLGESVNLEMVWTTPNLLTIKIGSSEVHKISIPWLIDSVGVSASTGELEIDPLVLGSVPD